MNSDLLFYAIGDTPSQTIETSLLVDHYKNPKRLTDFELRVSFSLYLLNHPTYLNLDFTFSFFFQVLLLTIHMLIDCRVMLMCDLQNETCL